MVCYLSPSPAIHNEIKKRNRLINLAKTKHYALELNADNSLTLEMKTDRSLANLWIDQTVSMEEYRSTFHFLCGSLRGLIWGSFRGSIWGLSRGAQRDMEEQTAADQESVLSIYLLWPQTRATVEEPSVLYINGVNKPRSFFPEISVQSGMEERTIDDIQDHGTKLSDSLDILLTHFQEEEIQLVLMNDDLESHEALFHQSLNKIINFAQENHSAKKSL